MIRVATPIFEYTLPKHLDQLLIYVTLNQHAKNQAISLINSDDMVD